MYIEYMFVHWHDKKLILWYRCVSKNILRIYVSDLDSSTDEFFLMSNRDFRLHAAFVYHQPVLHCFCWLRNIIVALLVIDASCVICNTDWLNAISSYGIECFNACYWCFGMATCHVPFCPEGMGILPLVTELGWVTGNRSSPRTFPGLFILFLYF